MVVGLLGRVLGVLGGLLEALGGVLEGCWGHLGSKMAPRAKKTLKINFWAPLLGGMLGPKIVKNRSQERSKR